VPLANDAGGRECIWLVAASGLGVSLAIAPRPPVRAVTNASSGGSTVRMRLDYPPWALRRAPRIRKSIIIIDTSSRAITCEAEAELVNAVNPDSNLCRIRLLPIGVRGRQHDDAT